MATVASVVAAATAASAASSMMDVPESQRLIALSLGKIAASRGQKGGINLHKNLLVATVLTKARAAYMIQHMNAARQRAVHVAAASSPLSAPSSSTSSSSSSPQCVEMKEEKPVAEPMQSSASATTSTTTTTSTAPAATSSPAATPTPLHHHSPPSPSQADPQSVTPSATQENPAPVASVPDGAAVPCSLQVSHEDKENTPPPSSPPSPPASPPTTTPQDCEKRLQGDGGTDVREQTKLALSARYPTGPHHNSSTTTTTTFINRPSSTCCLLKRRRAMDRDHAENVSAPKVRIVESRVCADNTAHTTTTTPTSSSGVPEPMQCDSPQISNLVNIFNTSFSGLSGAGGQSTTVLVSASSSPGPSPHPHHHHSHHHHHHHHHHSSSLSDSALSYCAKEMKVGGGGLDSVHQPSLVLSV